MFKFRLRAKVATRKRRKPRKTQSLRFEATDRETTIGLASIVFVVAAETTTALVPSTTSTEPLRDAFVADVALLPTLLDLWPPLVVADASIVFVDGLLGNNANVVLACYDEKLLIIE